MGVVELGVGTATCWLRCDLRARGSDECEVLVGAGEQQVQAPGQCQHRKRGFCRPHHRIPTISLGIQVPIPRTHRPTDAPWSRSIRSTLLWRRFFAPRDHQRWPNCDGNPDVGVPREPEDRHARDFRASPPDRLHIESTLESPRRLTRFTASRFAGIAAHEVEDSFAGSYTSRHVIGCVSHHAKYKK